MPPTGSSSGGIHRCGPWCCEWPATLIGLFAVYVVFEFGRYSAGFDRASAAAERGDLQQVNAGLKKQIEDLHAQMAQLQTLQGGAVREHQEFSQQIAGTAGPDRS